MKATEAVKATTAVATTTAPDAHTEQVQEYWESRSAGGAVCRAVMTGVLLAFCLWAASRADAAGLLKPVSGADLSALSIQSQDVNVIINNGFARTEVDQVFANSGDADIEAIYSFPVPRQASLSEVSLWIDGREVIGEVIAKEKARAVYEEQVAKGNETALAEKNDYRSFDISVGRVRAGSTTRIRLVYYQPLDIELNVGRYLYPLAEGGTDDARLAFWSTDNRVTGPFRFHLTLKSAFPIRDVRVPGFEQVAVITRDTNTADAVTYTVALDQSSGATLSRDLIVYYRLDDTIPARVELVPFRDSEKSPGTFMAVITPAASLSRIAEGSDWTFVLDVSGSMAGGKIAALGDGVAQAIGTLNPQDRFRIVTFNDHARDLTGGYLAATPANTAHWLQQARALQSGGSTALFDGLSEAYRSLDADRTSAVLLVTDGVCNVGPTAHRAFLDLLRQHDVRLFTFIIGNGANQPLMERLALESGGFAMTLSDGDDIAGRLLQAKARILNTCMHDVRIRFDGERVTDLAPARVPNLYLGQQAVLFGHYNGEGPAELVMTARISGEEKTWRTPVQFPAVDRDCPELERLWALARIEDLMQDIRLEERDSLKAAVRDLGVEYSLVTDYTSMLVVQEDVFESAGVDRRNAGRVQREREAQARTAAAPAPSRRVDNGSTFGNLPSPGLGTGPVGPLFVLVAAWAARRRRLAA
jgi:Ca-activated chloride channel family protein